MHASLEVTWKTKHVLSRVLSSVNIIVIALIERFLHGGHVEDETCDFTSFSSLDNIVFALLC